MATPKQVTYLLVLLAKAGYPTRHMGSAHKDLGATMKERSGPVEGWLSRMDAGTASALIERLKAKVGD